MMRVRRRGDSLIFPFPLANIARRSQIRLASFFEVWMLEIAVGR
jgi:hypothetical protein